MWICRSVATSTAGTKVNCIRTSPIPTGCRSANKSRDPALQWIGLDCRPLISQDSKETVWVPGHRIRTALWVCGSCWTDGWLTITLTMLSRFSSSSTTEIIEYSPAGEMQRVASTTRVPEDCLYRLHRILGCNLTTQICCPALASGGRFRQVAWRRRDFRVQATLDADASCAAVTYNFSPLAKDYAYFGLIPYRKLKGSPRFLLAAPSSWDVASPAFWYEFLCRGARSRRFRWRFPADPWPRIPDLGALSVGTDIIGWPTRPDGRIDL